MAKAMWPLTDSMAPYWLSGTRTDVPAEHPPPPTPPRIDHGVGVIQSLVCSVLQIMVLFCFFFLFLNLIFFFFMVRPSLIYEF